MQKITFRKSKHFKWQQPDCNNYILYIDGKKTKFYIYKSNIDPLEVNYGGDYQTCHLLDIADDYGYESICNDEGRCRFNDIDQAKRFMVEYLNREQHERKDIF